MKPCARTSIPEDTRAMCVSLFGPENTLRIVGEQLSEFVRDEDFSALYSAEGKPAVSPP